MRTEDIAIIWNSLSSYTAAPQPLVKIQNVQPIFIWTNPLTGEHNLPLLCLVLVFLIMLHLQDKHHSRTEIHIFPICLVMSQIGARSFGHQQILLKQCFSTDPRVFLYQRIKICLVRINHRCVFFPYNSARCSYSYELKGHTYCTYRVSANMDVQGHVLYIFLGLVKKEFQINLI